MALLPDIPNHVPSEIYLNGNWTSTIAPFWCGGPSKFWVVYKYNARRHGKFHIANIVFICEFMSLFYLKNTLQVLLSDVEDLQSFELSINIMPVVMVNFTLQTLFLFVSLLAFSTWRIPSECMSHFSCLLDDKLDLRAALQMRSARSWPQCMIVSCMLTDSELGTAFCAF